MTQSEYQSAIKRIHSDYQRSKKSAGQLPGSYYLALLRERNDKLAKVTAAYYGTEYKERWEV